MNYLANKIAAITPLTREQLLELKRVLTYAQRAADECLANLPEQKATEWMCALRYVVKWLEKGAQPIITEFDTHAQALAFHRANLKCGHHSELDFLTFTQPTKETPCPNSPPQTPTL